MNSTVSAIAAAASFLLLAGCSSTTTTVAGAPGSDGDAGAGGAGTGAGDDDGGASNGDAGAPSACAAAPGPSQCKNASSWVRGVARFDPAHFAAGAHPVLRVALRHSFALLPGEDAIGGRLHAFDSFPVKDPSKGEIPFAIDMCGLGTAMWSEENGGFHVVLMLDENDNNDLDMARSNDDAIRMATPDTNELAKVVDTDVSCHAASPCLDVTLDCTGGAACTTIKPITACKKKTPSCPSDDAYCK